MSQSSCSQASRYDLVWPSRCTFVKFRKQKQARDHTWAASCYLLSKQSPGGTWFFYDSFISQYSSIRYQLHGYQEAGPGHQCTDVDSSIHLIPYNKSIFLKYTIRDPVFCNWSLSHTQLKLCCSKDDQTSQYHLDGCRIPNTDNHLCSIQMGSHLCGWLRPKCWKQNLPSWLSTTVHLSWVRST